MPKIISFILFTMTILPCLSQAFAQEDVSKEMFIEYFPYNPNLIEKLNKNQIESISYHYIQSDTPQVKLRIVDTYTTHYPARSYVIYSFDFWDGDGDIVFNSKRAWVHVLLQGTNFKMSGGVGGSFLNWPGVTSGGVCHSIGVDGIVTGSCLFSIFLKDASGHESNKDSTMALFDSSRPAPALRTSMNKLHFGNIAIGDSIDTTFTIFNDGGRDLSVHLFTNDSKYLITSTHFFSISSGGSQDVKIFFSPDSAIQQNATLHLASNDPKNQCIRIPLSGHGIPTTVKDVVSISLPDKFDLIQNYPNPFNSTTTIRYILPEYSHVTLKIFNTLGEEIETLINANHSIGKHNIQWDAGNSPSGIYFYRLETEKFFVTKKLVLLK